MPVSNKAQRIEVLDALRGFALLGLFLCHMTGYFGLYWQNPEPSWVHRFVITVFNSKSYALFALLFGVSFNLLMQGKADKGIDYRNVYRWRLVILYVLGYFHGCLYYGDVLSPLALCGFILLATYHLSTKALASISLALLLLIPVWIQMGIYAFFSIDITKPYYLQCQIPAAQVYMSGGLLEVLSKNALWGQVGKWAYLIELGRIWKILGLFFLGVILGRIKFFEMATQHLRLMWILALCWGLAIPLTNTVQSLILQNATHPTVINFINHTFSAYQATNVLFLQVALFVIIYQQPWIKKLLDLLAPCGRMSLSFYVLQSIIGVSIYYYFGFNLYPSITPEGALALALALWVAQVMLAQAWLREHDHGPLERGWRTLSSLCVRQGRYAT